MIYEITVGGKNGSKYTVTHARKDLDGYKYGIGVYEIMNDKNEFQGFARVQPPYKNARAYYMSFQGRYYRMRDLIASTGCLLAQDWRTKEYFDVPGSTTYFKTVASGEEGWDDLNLAERHDKVLYKWRAALLFKMWLSLAETEKMSLSRSWEEKNHVVDDVLAQRELWVAKVEKTMEIAQARRDPWLVHFV